MKIKREDFLSVIKRVSPAVKVRSTMPVLSTIKIQALNGRFHAMACDGDSFVESICECNGNLMACCVVPGPLLALSAYGPETISLELEENRLSVDSGSKARLSVMQAEEFPTFPKDKLVDLGVNCSDLADAIQSVSWAADIKSSKGLMYQSVFVHLDGKNQKIVSGALDGRKLGYVVKPSVVPEAALYLLTEYAPLLVDALKGRNPRLRTNEDGWIVVLCDDLYVAVKQVPSFDFPLKPLSQAKDKSTPLGSFQREPIMRELETMQTVGRDLNGYVYGKATFGESLSLDYVNSVNEFHSVIPVDANAKQPKAKCGGDEVDRKQSVSAGAKPRLSAPVTAQNPTTTIQFDAALLHNILKNCQTESVAMSTDEMALFMESGDLVCALALVRNTP